jgi:IS5 family transposase
MNRSGERDPEMHQTKKGNQWHFGLKAHIGVGARTGITHSFTTTAANWKDLNQAEHLLHGDEAFIFADAGYRGAEKRDELKDVGADWHIAEQPGKLKALKKHPRINKVRIRTEYLKASLCAKVEHPFRIIKCQFGFMKARYRGLKKNEGKLAMLFALSNVVRVDQMLRAQG